MPLIKVHFTSCHSSLTVSSVNASPENTDSSFMKNNDLQQDKIVAIRLQWVTKSALSLLCIFQFDKWHSQPPPPPVSNYIH